MSRSTAGIVAALCCAVALVALAADSPSSAAGPQAAVPAELIKFHGHECPGVTIGYRMATEAMKAFPADTKVIAIAENRTCGVDALQWVTGCTAGKSNLILKDYGKQAYTVYSPETKKGVRVVFDSQRVPAEVRQDPQEFIKWLLTSDAKAFLIIQQVEVNEPQAPRTRESAPCAVCGESAALTHLRESGGKKVCIPCAGKNTAAK